MGFKYLNMFFLFISIIGCFCKQSNAQDSLSLKEVVTIALKNNFDIILAKNDAEILANNVTYGNAGLLPSLTADAIQNNQIQSSNVDLSNGGSRTARNVKTTSLNYGVNLNWTLFNGFKMFTNYQQLQKFKDLGELNSQLMLQTKLSEIIQSYHLINSLEQQLSANQTALNVSNLRVKNADSRFKLGRGSKLELLAANVDLNTDSSALMRIQESLKINKINLNNLMGRDAAIEFVAVDDFDINTNLNYEDLLSQTILNNKDIEGAKLNQSIANLYLKQIKADRYPVFTFNSGYNFNNATLPPTSFAQRINSNGFNYGIIASFNIFNGSQQRRLEKNAQISITNAQLTLEKTTEMMKAQLLSTYETYQTNLKLVDIEKRNITIAKNNLDITLEKYKLGNIVPLELREAQRNYTDANARYFQTLYQTKISETILYQIAGNPMIQD